jgi:hypothetical protein
LTAAFRWENGFEDRELANGLQVAAKVVYAITYNNSLVIDNQSQVNFVLNKALDFNPTLPYWCINEGECWKDMAELI